MCARAILYPTHLNVSRRADSLRNDALSYGPSPTPIHLCVCSPARANSAVFSTELSRQAKDRDKLHALLLLQQARVVLGRVRRARARGRVAPLPSSSRDSQRQGPFRAPRLPINSRMLRNKGVSFPESQLGPCRYLRAAHSIMITFPSPSLASCTPIMSVDQRTFVAAILPAPLTRGDPSIGQERRSCCVSRGDETTSRSRPSSSSPRPRDPRSAAL